MLCANCNENEADRNDIGYYRDYQGNKWDSVVRPICNACIEAGKYLEEEEKLRLYLGSSRNFRLKLNHGYEDMKGWGY